MLGLGSGAWRAGVSRRLRPLEVRANPRRGGGTMHARGASVPSREGLGPAPSRRIQTPNTFPSRHPRPATIAPPGPRPGFPQVTEVGLGTDRRTALSAPTASGPLWPRPSSPRPSLAGLPRAHPRPGAALTAQQEEEAEGGGSPRAGRRGPRAAGRELRPERGHRAESRRGGAGAAPGPGGGAYIPGPSRRKPRRFLAGAGTAAATWGAGATPGPAGWRGSRRLTRPWRRPLPPPRGPWPTLSCSAPRGAGQLPS